MLTCMNALIRTISWAILPDKWNERPNGACPGPWRGIAVPDGRRRDDHHRQSHGNITPGPERRRRDGSDGTMTGKKVSCMEEKEVSRMERFKAQCMNPKCSGHPGPVAELAIMKIGCIELSRYAWNFQGFSGIRRPKTRVRRPMIAPRTDHKCTVNVPYDPHECWVCGPGNKNSNMAVQRPCIKRSQNTRG